MIEFTINGAQEYERAQQEEKGKLDNMASELEEEVEKMKKQKLTVEEILKNYSAEEIAKDNDLLEKVLKNPTSEVINLLTTSKEAMVALGESKIAKEVIMSSDEFGKAVANSPYRKDFSEYIVYNAGTLCASANGRAYYKVSDGVALSVIFYVSGNQMLFVSKNREAAEGYSNFNPSYRYEIRELEYNGKTWYYSPMPYTWTDGTIFEAIYYGKNIGNITGGEYWEMYKKAAIQALDDFFNG